MVITDELFAGSCYYIGPGLDAQPLWRLSHLCDTFLFANLYLPKDQVRTWYERQIQYHNDAELLAVEDLPDFDEWTYLTPAAQARQAALDTTFMTAAEQRDYAGAFGPARHEPEWGLVFTIRRPSLGRTIRLLYFTAEGLATYLGLSDNGRLAPRVLVTIDTKVLENPDGMMNRLLERPHVRKPLLWVRGFAPAYVPFRFTNHALANRGALPAVAAGFMHEWTCGWSYDYQPSDRRHCRAFATADTVRHLQSWPVRAAFTDARHGYHLGRLDPAALPATDLVVAPQRLLSHLGLPAPNAVAWETVGVCEDWQRRTLPAVQQLTALAAWLAAQTGPLPTVLHLLPTCAEDEGQAYAHAVRQLPCPTRTYLPEPADFLDLRWPSLQALADLSAAQAAR